MLASWKIPRSGEISRGFVSDTLNPHERPFTGMPDRHPRSASGRGGCFPFPLGAGRVSFPWFRCQRSSPMVTDSAS